jgi:hypothetical protein
MEPMKKPHINLLTMLHAASGVSSVVNDAFDIEQNLTEHHPVDLHKLAADIHTLVNGFGFPFPDHFNNEEVALWFIEGGIANVQAKMATPA